MGMPIVVAAVSPRRQRTEDRLPEVDEQASGIVNAWRGDLLQDHVLADAFLRRLRIFYDVAAAAVQESVTAAGGSVRQIFLLQQDCGYATQCKGPTRDLLRLRLRQ